MSTFHPAASSLANFSDTILMISTTRLFIYIGCYHQDKNRLSWHHSSHYLEIGNLRLIPNMCLIMKCKSWPHLPKPRHLFGSTCTWQRIQQVKRTWKLSVLTWCSPWDCSFGIKRMRLLSHVYGICLPLVEHTHSCLHSWLLFTLILYSDC